ncbi:MAG: serine/threonine-protein kinase [Mycobacteriales bacterium]
MSLVGAYEMIGPVGSGSTATVWKARDNQLDRFVALKRLDNATSHLREQWRAEARTLASLSEPHIVEVYGFAEEADTAYIVEEWVEGATLAAVLAAAGQLSAAQALGVIRGALLGLAHAHERGVVHRDVSAGNILVDQTGTSRLIDFGLAAATGTIGSHGTSAYRSPEAAGEQPVTPASDVYSAAAVLTHLLTGTASVPPATELIDAELRSVVRRALADDPGDRYPDAGSFLGALEEAAERRYGAAWWTEAGMAALVGGAGVAVVGAAGDGKRTSRDATLAASVMVPEPTRATVAGGMSKRSKLIAAAAAAAVIIAGIGAAAANRGKTSDDPTPAASSASVIGSGAPAPTPAPTPSPTVSATLSTTPTPSSSSLAPVLSPTSSAPPSPKPPAVSPAQAIAGKFTNNGTWTKLNVTLIDEKTGADTKPGDPFGPFEWTITAKCVANTCTATIVSASGIRYPLKLVTGHWRGRSTTTNQCYDSNNKPIPNKVGTVLIDVDIPDPSATLTKAPSKLTGTTVRTYDTACGGSGGTATVAIVLTRHA